jgi:hypothetical protein
MKSAISPLPSSQNTTAAADPIKRSSGYSKIDRRPFPEGFSLVMSNPAAARSMVSKEPLPKISCYAGERKMLVPSIADKSEV